MSWKNFVLEEFACKHCGENQIEHELIDNSTGVRKIRIIRPVVEQKREDRSPS